MTEEWETVAENTRRLRIPGGWLYALRPWGENYDTPVALAFVPDTKAITADAADGLTALNRLLDTWATEREALWPGVRDKE